MLRSLPSLPALGMGHGLDDRSHSPLPPIGHDISRPSSTSTQSSNILRQQHQSTGQSNGGGGGVSLPGMSALASVASTQSPQMRSFSAVNQGLNYATPSPTPTSVGGQGNSPPVCQNCQTSTTPLWRRDELGSVLCNACGLFLKLHGRPRPISLKTDVIKSRNRVKSSGQAIKKAAKALLNGNNARSEAGTPPPGLRRVSGKSGSDRSNSPISRTTTPALHHPTALPPHHTFDTSHLPDHHLHHSPSLPALGSLRQPSPGSIPSLGDRHLEPPQTYESLQTANTALKTRVSELEVINGLYKGRVQDLERAEAAQRQALEQSRAREEDMRRRLEDLEYYVAELRRDSPNHNAAKRRLDGEMLRAPEHSPPNAKRTRLSDVSDVAQYPEPSRTPTSA